MGVKNHRIYDFCRWRDAQRRPCSLTFWEFAESGFRKRSFVFEIQKGWFYLPLLCVPPTAEALPILLFKMGKHFNIINSWSLAGTYNDGPELLIVRQEYVGYRQRQERQSIHELVFSGISQ